MIKSSQPEISALKLLPGTEIVSYLPIFERLGKEIVRREEQRNLLNRALAIAGEVEHEAKERAG